MNTYYKSFDEYGLKYFSTHLVSSEKWKELYSLLTDICFLDIKCQKMMVFDLLRDYRSSLEALPQSYNESKIYYSHFAPKLSHFSNLENGQKSPKFYKNMRLKPVSQTIACNRP